VPPPHRLERVEVDDAFTAVCACGWRSGRVGRRASAVTRCSIHCRLAGATTTYRRAEEFRTRAVQQAAEARAKRAAVRQRADRLRGPAPASPVVTAARPADVVTGGRQAHVVTTARGAGIVPGEPARLLESARALSGLTVYDLWLRYVMLGGSASTEELSAMLSCAVPLGHYDHDMIALALNECFADAGFGHPLDFLGGR